MLQGHIVMHITLFFCSYGIETNVYKVNYHDPEKDVAFETIRKYFVNDELLIFQIL